VWNYLTIDSPSYSVAVARSTLALFHFDTLSSPPQRIRLAPDTLFYSSRELDFTAVGLERRLRSTCPVPPCLAPPADQDTALCMVHHPRGLPKETAAGCCQVGLCDEQYLRYEAPSDYGSSGAPLFTDSGDIIAMHVRGDHRDDSPGNQGGKLGEALGAPDPTQAWHTRYVSSPPPRSPRLGNGLEKSLSTAGAVRLCKAVRIGPILRDLRASVGPLPGEAQGPAAAASSPLQSRIDALPLGGRLLRVV